MITVCPASAPVGGVVRVTVDHCDPAPGGRPTLVFLGPDSVMGSGGGGVEVPLHYGTGDVATATFRIPATYTGREVSQRTPTLNVAPGRGYHFATLPAGLCGVPFTVTGEQAG